MHVRTLIIPFAMALSAAQPAYAASDNAFGVPAESDASLAQMSGGAIGPSLVSNARLILDSNSRAIMRASAETAQVSMENWWFETGSLMIATNVLASRLGQ